MKKWRRSSGASISKGKGTFFSVWAPYAKNVDLKILTPKEKYIPMHPQADGYYTLSLPEIEEELDYFFVINGDELADPASNWQPNGVKGPSRPLDHSKFQWSDENWKGIPLQDHIIYELHVGTFTEKGTFEAIIEKLPHLQKLGITAIELMPISSFPGDRNWGYDGVFPFAPQESYGGPSGLKSLVNSCHEMGIAVLLDVVYNHFGPEGSVFHSFGPYMTDKYHTPWGKALNFDGKDSAPVRQYIIDNALYFLSDYHIDGLRLDAIDGIFDTSPKHILQELQEEFHLQASRIGKEAWITAESDLNEAKLIEPVSQNGYGIDAVWGDEYHHALRTLLIADHSAYFVDFGKMSDLKKAIVEGFVYDGRWSTYREKEFGTSSKHLPGDKFVIFSQNHDQIANASKGKTFVDLISKDQLKVAACILLFSPSIPLLFMGQEWGSKAPFDFFTSFESKSLAEAVKEGRKKEYEAHYIAEMFKDPQDPQTFFDSKLQWEQRDNEILTLYEKLIAMRKSHPAMQNFDRQSVRVIIDESKRFISITRQSADCAEMIKLVANMGNKELKLKEEQMQIRLDTRDKGAPPNALPPWSAYIASS
ncbi:MAG: malto-oligosyltrehalose trehalohydrolase [Waddliaceae bacterium]